MKNNKQLIERVIEQIEKDLPTRRMDGVCHNGSYEAVEELLSFVPVPNLIQYLDEDEWCEYEGFEEMNQEARNRAKEVVNYGKV